MFQNLEDLVTWVEWKELSHRDKGWPTEVAMLWKRSIPTNNQFSWTEEPKRRVPSSLDSNPSSFLCHIKRRGNTRERLKLSRGQPSLVKILRESQWPINRSRKATLTYSVGTMSNRKSRNSTQGSKPSRPSKTNRGWGRSMIEIWTNRSINFWARNLSPFQLRIGSLEATYPRKQRSHSLINMTPYLMRPSRWPARLITKPHIRCT